MPHLAGRPGIVLLAALLAGCEKPGRGPSTEAQPAGGDLGGPSLKKGIARQAASSELHQIGQFYVMYHTEFNRSPARLDDLKGYMAREAPKLYRAIEDGTYEVNWKVPTLSHQAALAYEREADSKGMRFVVMGDGSVQKLDGQHLRSALGR